MRARPASRAACRRGSGTARGPGRPPGAEPKHSSASRGSSTMGRPAVFRLVFTITGRPVRAAKPSSIPATSGCCVAVHGLHPGRAVHVHHRGDPVPPRRGHLVHEQHVRAGQRAVEDLRRPLGQHHRRHRPELLPALHRVQPVQVVPAAGVGEQRAAAQGPRAELAAALEPGHDAVGGQFGGDRVGDAGRPLVGPGRGVQPGGQFCRRTSPGPGTRPASASTASPASPASAERAAERGARVAGRGLHPDPARTGPRGPAGSWPRSSAPPRPPWPGRGPRSGRAASGPGRAGHPRSPAGRWRPGPRDRRSAARPGPALDQAVPVGTGSVRKPPSPSAYTSRDSSAANRGVP